MPPRQSRLPKQTLPLLLKAEKEFIGYHVGLLVWSNAHSSGMENTHLYFVHFYHALSTLPSSTSSSSSFPLIPFPSVPSSVKEVCHQEKGGGRPVVRKRNNIEYGKMDA